MLGETSSFTSAQTSDTDRKTAVRQAFTHRHTFTYRGLHKDIPPAPYTRAHAYTQHLHIHKKTCMHTNTVSRTTTTTPTHHRTHHPPPPIWSGLSVHIASASDITSGFSDPLDYNRLSCCYFTAWFHFILALKGNDNERNVTVWFGLVG